MDINEIKYKCNNAENAPTQLDVDLAFLESKGFDVSITAGLLKAKRWLETADPDELMYGEPTGDPFDIFVGSARRGMLIESVNKAIKKHGLS